MSRPFVIHILIYLLHLKLYQVTCVITALYYMDTNEIPGELSRENMISSQCENDMLSSHVKRSRLLWLHDTSRLVQQKKMLK